MTSLYRALAVTVWLIVVMLCLAQLTLPPLPAVSSSTTTWLARGWNVADCPEELRRSMLLTRAEIRGLCELSFEEWAARGGHR